MSEHSNLIPGAVLAAALVEVLDAGTALHDVARAALSRAHGRHGDRRPTKGEIQAGLDGWQAASRAMLRLICEDLGPAAPRSLRDAPLACDLLRDDEVGHA